MADKKRRKDPAFLFYPGDASDDTQFMNRLERGCYFDLLKAQKKHRRFTMELIKKVLGRDFDTCWASIELVLKKEDELYFIEWIENAIEDRAAHAAIQKKRIQDYWDKKKATESDDGITTEQPKHNQGNTLEDEDEDEIVNENEDEEKLKEYDRWTEQIIDGNDHLFLNMFQNEMIPPGDHIQFWIADHRDLLNRYPKMRPPTQQAFRKSCMKHIRENYKKQPSANGKINNSKQQQSDATADYLKNYYSQRAARKPV